MKNISTASVTFNAAAKTVNTGIGSFDIRKLYAIINTTASKIIYATGVTGLGYTNVASSTVTLVFDTTSMSNGDILQVIYDNSTITVDGSGVTQPISGTVTANTGLTQPLTDTQLRATAVPTSNSNFDVALSTRLKPADTLAGITTVGALTAITNALPTGANTIGAVNINGIVNAGIPALGQAVSASSLPVTLSSEQSIDYTLTSGTTTVVGNNILLATPGSGGLDLQTLVPGVSFHSMTVQLNFATGTVTGGFLIFEGSNDNFATTAGTVQLIDPTISGANNIVNSLSISSATTKFYTGNIYYRYIRARLSSAITGTTTGAQCITLFRSVTLPTQLATVAVVTAPSTTVTGTLTANQGTANAAAWLANPLTPAVSTTGDTGAKTATFNGATQTNVSANGVALVFNIGVVSGTTPTLVAKLQGSADGGTTFWDLPATVATATIVATGTYGIQLYPGIPVLAPSATAGTTGTWNGILPRTWRVVYTIGGTTPSFTLTNVQINYIL